MAVAVGLVLLALATSTLEAQGTRAQRGSGQARRYQMQGLVVAVDAAARSVVISHDSVPGLMPAMSMPFDVRSARDLDGLEPGLAVRFTLVLDDDAHIEAVEVVPFESVEQDPLTARRLSLLTRGLSSRKPAVATGQAVPDFTLTDQTRHQVRLSSLRGKVVAINFIYTSCALPQFCFRVANHFGAVEKRFRQQAGRDLVLLTVTFDPVRDTPERLAEYAKQWQADPRSWHFLTGATADVRRVCEMFGVDAFQDEGLVNHSVHTVVIDRRGRLAADVEGNRVTAAQIGDLVAEVLRR